MSALMPTTLGEVAAMLHSTTDAGHVAFKRINTDSRSIQAGELFVALSGESFNGHEYVNAAFEQGAVGAVVSEMVHTTLPLLRVADTTKALGDLAKAIRAKYNGVVVGVTGSNGKTTVKEMLNAILSQCGQVLATKGNFNNDIGLPKTLMQLQQEHDFAVFEMGANHPGDIEYLAAIGQPHIGVITNVGAAHLDGFGSLAGVARAKAELYQSLSPTGTAIINADDQYAPMWQSIAEQSQCLMFGMTGQNADVDVYAENMRVDEKGSEFSLCTPQGNVIVNTPFLGQHNVLNALAASAAALAAGVTLADIQQGLLHCEPVQGRLNIKPGIEHSCILDDTYNANPQSLQAGIDVLASFPGRHILVLGDMLELGDEADQLHEQAGRAAKAGRLDQLYCLGQHSKHAVKGFGDGRHYTEHADLLKDLKTRINAGDVILVKGSRSMQMEKIVNGLLYLSDTEV